METKQQTFYGDYAESEAIEWFQHFRKIYDITSVYMKIYTKKMNYHSEKRVQLKVKYYKP